MTARHRHRRLHRLDRLPPGVKMVDRSSRWGSPYVWRGADVKPCRPLGRTTVLVANRAEAVYLYRLDLEARTDLADWLAPLADSVALACTCPLDALCHADVLLEHLNRLHPTREDLP